MEEQYLCVSNYVKEGSFAFKICDVLAYSSKNVYNSDNYFTKHAYILHKLILEYYYQNFHQYDNKLSLRDKILLIKYTIKSNKEHGKIIDILTTIKKRDFNEVYEVLELPGFKNFMNKHKESMKDGTDKKAFDYKLFCSSLKKIKNEIIFDIDPANFKVFIDDFIKVYDKEKRVINRKWKPPKKKGSNKKIGKRKRRAPVIKKAKKISIPNQNFLIPPSFIDDKQSYKYVNHKLKKVYLPAQCVQQTCKKVSENYKSFFGLLEKGSQKAETPRYLDKQGVFNVIFQNNSFKIEILNGGIYLRLSLGSDFSNNFSSIFKGNNLIFVNGNKKYIYKNELRLCLTQKPENFKCYFKFNYEGKTYYINKQSTTIKNTQYLYIRVGSEKSERDRKKLIENKIIEVELVPKYEGVMYKICMKYKKNVLSEEASIKDIKNVVKNKEYEIADQIINTDLNKLNVETMKQIEMFKSNLKNEIFIANQLKSKEYYNLVVNTINEDNKEMHKKLNPTTMSIDLGEVNLATIITDIFDTPIIIDGRPLRNINYESNKAIEKYKSYIKRKFNLDTDAYLQKLYDKKTRTMDNYFHKISIAIIEYAKYRNIKNIVVGYNVGWKDKSDLGTDTNKRFQEIPYRRFLDKLFYKAKIAGIKFEEINEDCTSVCDALSYEPLMKATKKNGHKHWGTKKFQGRGLYYSYKKKVYINRDVNGALNIMRKYALKYKNNELLQKLTDIIVGGIEELKRPKKISVMNSTKVLKAKRGRIMITQSLIEEMKREYIRETSPTTRGSRHMHSDSAAHHRDKKHIEI